MRMIGAYIDCSQKVSTLFKDFFNGLANYLSLGTAQLRGLMNQFRL